MAEQTDDTCPEFLEERLSLDDAWLSSGERSFCLSKRATGQIAPRVLSFPLENPVLLECADVST